jgi:hypothetical protein
LSGQAKSASKIGKQNRRAANLPRGWDSFRVLTCIKLCSDGGRYDFTMTKCPTCPYCARTMTLVHQPDATRSRRDVYECGHCGAVFSEAPTLGSPAIDRAMVLNFGAPAIQH